MARRAKEKTMMTLRVTRNGFEPAGPYDAEVHSRLNLGAPVTVTVEQEKNTDLLNLYWGFLDWAVSNCDALDHMEKRSLSDHVLMSLGYVESYTVLIGGGIQTYPRSIAEMDRETFDRLCTRAFDFIYGEFGLDVDAYKAEMRAKAGGRR
jgi:hypothetical protein